MRTAAVPHLWSVIHIRTRAGRAEGDPSSPRELVDLHAQGNHDGDGDGFPGSRPAQPDHVDRTGPWVGGAARDIVTVLSSEGFEECKREQTTSRQNGRPAGGLWQGVNPRTGSVASALWVNRPAWLQDIVFIQVDGEPLAGGEGGCGED